MPAMNVPYPYLPGHSVHGDRVRAQCVRVGTANSTEFDPSTADRVIYKFARAEGRGMSWAGRCVLARISACSPRIVFARAAYAKPEISERHRHRYEFQSRVRDAAQGTWPAAHRRDSGCGVRRESVELADHPWYLGCQFHPEFKSKPLDRNPLFRAFIGASLEHRRRKMDAAREAAEIRETCVPQLNDGVKDRSRGPSAHQPAPCGRGSESVICAIGH